MNEFVLELYVSRDDAGGAERCAQRMRQAAAELTREGREVRCVQRIFLPEEETCLLLCEAESDAAVRDAARRAGLDFERVSASLAEERA
jgi:hypothetical protein